MITTEHSPSIETVDDLLLGEPEPPTVKLPTREMKLGTLRRLDRTSEIVRPLQRIAPLVSGLAAVGGLVLAALLFFASGKKRTFFSLLRA